MSWRVVLDYPNGWTVSPFSTVIVADGLTEEKAVRRAERLNELIQFRESAIRFYAEQEPAPEKIDWAAYVRKIDDVFCQWEGDYKQDADEKFVRAVCEIVADLKGVE